MGPMQPVGVNIFCRSEQVFFLIILIACLCGSAIAQEPDSTRSLPVYGLRLHRSFIIQHSPRLSREITHTNPIILEADLGWYLRRQRIWEYCQCYPRTGISLIYTYFDMPRTLGSALGLCAYVEPYIRADRNLNFSVRFGMGPVYLTRIYDERTNPDNLFFSSPVSFLVLLSPAMNYRLSPHATVRLLISYNHISNGGISEPNLGMNYPSVSVGFDYGFRGIHLSKRQSAGLTLQSARWRAEISAGLSAKPLEPGLRQRRYPIYVADFRYARVIGRIAALGASAEWTHDRSLYRLVRLEENRTRTGRYPGAGRLGVSGGVDWLFGKFVFYQHLGVYVYSPTAVRNRLYQRYGLNFSLSPKLFTGLSIKAHGQDADFMDLRVGYRFSMPVRTADKHPPQAFR